MSESKNPQINDIAFKHVMEKGPNELRIPFVNELYHTDYETNVLLVPVKREFIASSEKKNRAEENRADAVFTINGPDNVFHAEYQTWPKNDMPMRMADYGYQISRYKSVQEGSRTVFTLPRSGILYLHEKRTEDQDIVIKDGEQKIHHPLESLYMKRYTADELIRQRKWFLCMYWIYCYEDPVENQKQVLEDFRYLVSALQEAEEDKVISRITYDMVIAWMKEISMNAVRKNEELKKGIEDIMNEANIYIPGVKEFQEGKLEGKTEGILQGTLNTLRRFADSGKLSKDDAAETAGMSLAQFEEALKTVKQ